MSAISVKNPDYLFFSELTNQYICIKDFESFVSDNLVVYIKKNDNEGFIITSHPISKRRITRKIKKWKKLNL